jgi:Tol biopolymer transport system component
LALALGSLIALLALADPVGATFPGRNGRIAFMMEGSGSGAELWVANANGTHQRRVATGDTHRAAFSPDGTSIAFSRATVGHEPQIFVINPDGAHQRRLTNRSSGAANPSFSSTGRKLVFDSHGALFVMNADGGHQRLLAGDAVMPSYSPDGRRIAFFRPGQPGIWTMNANGSHQKRITAGQTDAGLSFSPDGRRIVFARQRPGAEGPYDIFMMNADGSHQRRFARDSSGGAIPALAFSPDGRKIAFPDTGGVILVMNAATGSIADKPLLVTASAIPVSLDWGARPR